MCLVLIYTDSAPPSPRATPPLAPNHQTGPEGRARCLLDYCTKCNYIGLAQAAPRALELLGLGSHHVRGHVRWFRKVPLGARISGPGVRMLAAMWGGGESSTVGMSKNGTGTGGMKYYKI